MRTFFDYERVIAEVFERILTQLPPLLLPTLAHPTVCILHMPCCWGSFITRTITIQLNPALVNTPRVCIEYIIFRKLTYLRQPRHDRALIGVV
jgi:predicted metal-dependent hydrolase